jgi:hypothetical protein
VIFKSLLRKNPGKGNTALKPRQNFNKTFSKENVFFYNFFYFFYLHLHIICPLNLVIIYSNYIITYCSWNFMRLCIAVFVHHVVYVACAPCEREWWHHHNYMCICYTKFYPTTLSCFDPDFRMGSVATTPKVWAIGRGSSPREVPNPSALPCDDRMGI